MTRIDIKEAAKVQLGKNIFGNAWMTGLLVCLIAGAVVFVAGSILPGFGAILLIGPMSYGLSYVFLKQTRDGKPINITDVFTGFTSDFGQNFLIGLLSGIFVALWSCLLVVPGIIKYYAYSMAYYIKIDHPDYGWKECLDLSQVLMDGHKWDLFIMDLSFIGWYMVGSFCLGVGTLWVEPYHFSSRTIFYESIRGEENEAPAQPQITGKTGWYQE